MRRCIADLVQAAEQLPVEDVKILTSMALVWASRNKSDDQTDFLSNSSNLDSNLPASSSLSLASGVARRK